MADAPALPFASVIVPVYNDAVRLALCLAALEAQTYPSDRYEVIVVDNGSDVPVTASIGSFPHARFEREPRPGGGYARMTGITFARGEIVAFTDADCLPEPGWISGGVECFLQTPNCGEVGGCIEVLPDHTSVAAILSAATQLKQERFVRDAKWAAFANVFTSRNVIELVPLNPALFSCGDVEWGARLHRAGYRQVYAPQAIVRHPARATVRQLCRRAVRFELAWRQLRATAGIGVGGRFWLGQHLVWPARDTYHGVMRNPRLTIPQKTAAAALAGYLMGLRIAVWLLLAVGVRYDVRKNWG